MKYFVARKHDSHSNLWRIENNKVNIFSWIHKDWTDSIATSDILTQDFTEVTQEKAKELFPDAF